MKKWLIPLLTFILVISSSMFVFASDYSNLPSYPSNAKYKDYVVWYKYGDTVRTYATNTNDIRYYAGNKVVWHEYMEGSVLNEQYELQNGVWVSIGSGSVNSTTGQEVICSGSDVLYSTFDIVTYNNQGNVFFSKILPLNLPEMALNLGVTTLNTEVPEVLGAMKILVLCGVGCLALLVSLPILSKVFYRFRARY